MPIISTGIRGLDLVLSGGLRVLERLPGVGDSGSLLIRGPAGSGKTVLGVQLAARMASALGGDIVYGCVELLPVELQAQVESLQMPNVPAPIAAPFPHRNPVMKESAFYAALLDLGEAGEEQKKLGAEVTRFLNDVKKIGAVPRVLVLDSVSDGYNLGRTAPRRLIDGLVKLVAELGMFLIVLEEITEPALSNWSFALDTVIEVASSAEDGPAGGTSPFERRMDIAKHRFRPSDAGPHRFSIEPGIGVEVSPRPSAYLHAWSTVD